MQSRCKHQHGKYPALLTSRYITKASNFVKERPVDLFMFVSIIKSVRSIYTDNLLSRKQLTTATDHAVRANMFLLIFFSGKRTHDRLRLPKVTETRSAASG